MNGEKVIIIGENMPVLKDYTPKATAGTDYKIRIEYMQVRRHCLDLIWVFITVSFHLRWLSDRVKEADIVIAGISLSLEGEEMYSVNSPGLLRRPYH